ncbi:MAG: trypsin-like peptidase domain-containing protein [Zoogloeaceae bacterium]|nr:trypsin-like peptidase domain-containing protein [Zoogloeaceae bacterium]
MNTFARISHGMQYLILVVGYVFFVAGSSASDFSELINNIKPSVVAVGTYLPTRNPSFQFRGTGFAVGDGSLIATNAHVVPDSIDEGKKEALVVARLYEGGRINVLTANRLRVDAVHDLALLKLTGSTRLPALAIGADGEIREGEEILFTGFPLGAALGMRPVTHRGMISAITPIGTPAANSRDLSANLVRRLSESYDVFQLDATAYPGNSGSPLIGITNGGVIGIINMVFVKGAKENALSQPSGITYAVPAKYLRKLIAEAKD